MKVTIERAALLRALAHVQSVVERRNTIPILSNVLLEAKDGKLALSATDMDLAIREEVPAEVGKAASTTTAAWTPGRTLNVASLDLTVDTRADLQTAVACTTGCDAIAVISALSSAPDIAASR